MAVQSGAIPPINLEPLHRAMKHPFPRPVNGIAWILILLVAGAIAGANLTERYAPVKDRVIDIGEAVKQRAPVLSPHERRLREAMAKLGQEDSSGSETGTENAVEPPRKVDLGLVPEGHVRVAAVQFYPLFGHTEHNRKRLEPYIRRAAKEGAKIVVLPEAAVTGYAEMNEEITWLNRAPETPREKDDHKDLTSVAEPADGASVTFFAPIADELDIYLTVPFIESSEAGYSSTVILLDPEGKPALHYRKLQPVPAYEKNWAVPGDRGAPVVQTPYGRVGVMIGYDGPKAVPQLAEEKADILLWCAAFRGDNQKLRAHLVMKVLAEKHHFATILANWTYRDAWWNGHGFSRVVSAEGKLLNRASDPTEETLQEELVVADLKIPAPGESATIDTSGGQE